MTAVERGRVRPTVAVLRLVTLVIGLWYLGLGIAGFVIQGGGMGPDESRVVWVFGVSALLNIGHTAVGALGVVAARTEATTRAFNWLLFFAFAGPCVYGIFATTVSELGNVVNMRPANVWLYGATSVLGLASSTVPVRTAKEADHSR